jgi:hypothetical protein
MFKCYLPVWVPHRAAEGSTGMNDKLKAFILEKLITNDRKQLLDELKAEIVRQAELVETDVMGDAFRHFRPISVSKVLAIIERKRAEL